MALDVQKISGTDAKAAARLCNFPTGHATLLQAHESWMDNDAANAIRNSLGPFIDIFAYASRVGSAQFNQDLSNKRLHKVKTYLEQFSDRVSFNLQTAFGESESGTTENNNDGYYRAVEVYIYGTKPPPKPVPNTVLQTTKRSFYKMTVNQNKLSKGDDPVKDAINELLKLGLTAAQGKLTAEGLLGDETNREKDYFPPNFRVNKVIIRTRRTLDQEPFVSVVTEKTDISYEWGPPTPTILIVHDFAFTWDKKPFSSSTTSQVVARAAAENTPLILPE